MKKVISIFIILFLIITLSSCGNNENYDVVTTNFVTYDFTKQIVGNNLSVKLIIPPGYDFHDYEPTSNDLLNIKKSNVFIYLSNLHDTWIKDENTLKGYLNNDATSISLINLINDEKELANNGSHFWTNPELISEIIINLGEELSLIYPNYKTLFVENANNYANSILNEANLFKDELANISKKEVYLIGHNAYLGMENFFNIKIVALENSVNPNADPTSNDINNFIRSIKDNDVTFLFHDETDPTYMVDAILEQVPNLVVKELHGFHHLSNKDTKDNVTYLDILIRNINNLREALNG